MLSSLGFKYADEGISGILTRNGLLPNQNSAGPKSLVDLPAAMDLEKTVWLLLPSGRVVREMAGMPPESVQVLSGPIRNRRGVEGFPATSIRVYRLQDVALLEASSHFD